MHCASLSTSLFKYAPCRLPGSVRFLIFPAFGDSDETWNFSIGCVLGELSGQLFPQTQQEYEHWEETKRRFEEHCKRHQDTQSRHTEPLPVLTALQET